MKLELDDNLKREGITDIRTIGNEIVILADLDNKEKRFAIEFKSGATRQNISEQLAIKLDKQLGRKLCQYIIQHICKPENFCIIDTYKEEEEISKDKKEKGTEIYIQRFTNYQYYAEAVLIDNKPKFLSVSNGEISIVDYIPNGDEIIKPLKALSYINKPYSFGSEQEVRDYIEKAKGQTLDTLYTRVKGDWKKFVDADDFHISICAADTIFTYYQNVAGMTHYLYFVGGPGSGKSNNLEVFHNLAYRNMTSYWNNSTKHLCFLPRS